MKKFKFFKRLVSMVCCVVLFGSVMTIFGCGDNLSDDGKAKQVIENTSSAIERVDDKIMTAFENQTGGANPMACIAFAEEVQGTPHLNIDRGSAHQAYTPISQMTISFGYYALSEYYLIYLNTFLFKTLAIEQTYYPNQQIWTKCEIDGEKMDIHIWTEYLNAFEECIDISIYYNAKTLQPIKFIHRENRHWLDGRNEFGYVEVDFANNTGIVETVMYTTGANIDYSTAQDETIVQNVGRYIREEFSFSDYKNKQTKMYKGITTDMTDEEFLDAARAFKYVYTRNAQSEFNFAGATAFARGNHAMDYAFDKYLILEDKDTGKLIRVRNPF